jgi:hypothetical protein
MLPDLRIIPAVFIAAIVLSMAGYAEAPAFSAPAQPTETSGSYTLDTPIEQIAAMPAGDAILRKDIPGLLENSSYPMFKAMSLKLVARLSGGRLTADTLAETQADLAKLPPTATPAPASLQQTAQAEPDFN